ncbi:uncharacterized protein K02A2.6-like [Copidosoma floridanum]|uniref:uncharacterized protein K02A2.6-like n=1 Tax=Copidosoma floridanum TaxID=29053 RepID=UPI0006C94C7B|nr:uncharacterized protein K02A2.6-like [Copidosoma floridanum]
MSDSHTDSNKCRDPMDIQKEKKGLSWVYKLNKEELTVELENRELELIGSEKFETLRKILAELVKEELSVEEEIENNKNAEAEDKQTGVTKEASSGSEEEEEMADKTKLEFCLKTDDWEIFTERLEVNFAAKDTKDEKKGLLLLTSLDEEAFMLVRNLCAPEKPSTKTYEELKKLLSDYLNPKLSEVMERWKFNQAKQEQGESVAEYAARLKRLALNCNFKELITALRNQLVCGIRDQDIKVELFKAENLTFDKALSESMSREMAKINALEASRKFYGSSNDKILALNTKQKRSYERDNTSRSKGSTDRKNMKSEKGISCYCCGRANHKAIDCKHRTKSCNYCKRKGHLEVACRRKAANENSSVKVMGEEATSRQSEGEDDDVTYNFLPLKVYSSDNRVLNCKRLGGSAREAEPMLLKFKIENKDVVLEVDTGIYVSVILEKTKNELFQNFKLSKSNIILRGYDENSTLHPVGTMENLEGQLNGITRKLTCVVLPGKGPPLVGRQWLSQFGLWPLKFANKNGESQSVIKKLKVEISDDILLEFSKLFSSGPGFYTKGEMKIYMKEEVKPIAFKARYVPYALREKVEKQLNNLVELGHLEKVDSSEWATPIVPIIKSNDNIRICGDFKFTINPYIIVNKHPLPHIDDIFRVLQGEKKFSQLDLTHAYMQIPVEKESRHLLTIITHLGLFRYTKLPEGISSAPGEFQRIIDACLQGTEGAVAYMDNIFITGKTNQEHIRNLKLVCKRLEEHGLKLNRNKCDIMKERIETLGFVIDKDGLHKAKTKVQAMIEASRPENIKQLESFLGLINFYNRFFKNRSENLRPLYECANNSKFKWTEECEKAFKWVKAELISPQVLTHYDPQETVVLACDASEYGLSAILSHRYKDGSEKPIAYA